MVTVDIGKLKTVPNEYRIAFDVFSRNLVNVQVEALDRSRKLKFAEAYHAFDFTGGLKLTLLEENISALKATEFKSVVDVIDGLIDQVLLTATS